MRLFHGTTEANLQILLPTSRDRQGDPVLYLTDNRVYGLFYIRDREIDFVTCGVDEQGIVHYDEKFKDQLKILYQGKSGYIYATEQDAQASKINGIYTFQGQAKVTSPEYIPDVYEVIRREIELGHVEFLSYEELTEEQRVLNHQGIVHMIKNVPMNPVKEAFVREYFPDAWEEAKKM